MTEKNNDDVVENNTPNVEEQSGKDSVKKATKTKTKKTTDKTKATKKRAKKTDDGSDKETKKTSKAKAKKTTVKVKNTAKKTDGGSDKETKKTSKAKAKKTSKTKSADTTVKRAAKASVKSSIAGNNITSYAVVKRTDIIEPEGMVATVAATKIPTAILVTIIACICAISSVPIFLFLQNDSDVHLPIDISLKMQQILAIFPILLIVIFSLILVKFIYQMTVSFSLPEELTEKDNPAVGISLSGYMIGMSLALLGMISHVNQNHDLLNNIPIIVKNIVPCFVLSAILMFISQLILDKIILYKFSIDKEISADRNIGTGAICCGAFIATGFILMKSFNTTIDQGLPEYILSVVSSFFVGQLIFIIGGWLFTMVSDFSFHYEIEYKDNASAGILFGGLLVGLGLVISASISSIKWEDPLLFSADITLQESFVGGKIDTKIMEVFKEKQAPLSIGAKIYSNVPNEWSIKNPGHLIQYHVKKENTQINIYSNNLVLLTAKRTFVAFLAGIIGIFLLLSMGIWAAKVLFFRVSIKEEVQQKNPAVTLLITCVYIITGFVIQALLHI